MEGLKLGVVSCLHGNIEAAIEFAEAFKEKEVDGVALIGDIPSDQDQEENFKEVLDIFSELEVPVFVSPGSHEHYADYYSAIEEFEGEEIVDCSEIQERSLEGESLVFLPGSSVNTSGGGFRLLSDREEEGEFRKVVEERSDHFTGKILSIFSEDVIEVAEEDSILITHDPPQFEGEEGIDRAKFGEAREEFRIKEEDREILDREYERIESGWPFPVEEARELKALGYPFEIKKDNVGDAFLNEILEETGMTKMICGHIHEAGGRAVDLEGKPVQEGEWSEEMLYNCAAGKDGRAGIVEFKEGKARYRNLER